MCIGVLIPTQDQLFLLSTSSTRVIYLLVLWTYIETLLKFFMHDLFKNYIMIHNDSPKTLVKDLMSAFL